MTVPVSIEEARRARTAAQTNSAPLNTSGGGGTFDGMEPRVAALEAHVEHIRSDVSEIKSDLKEIRRDMVADFRIGISALIALALGLAGIMAKGFHWF